MAKRSQKGFRQSRNSITPPPQQYCPAVSVIIPMYNAEKYVAECLDSILAQTFKNYEVIVVNDCSTDSSCAIVESYIPKFDGRLNLYHMDSNTGSGAMPRNKGMMLSRGEYIQLLDNDDFLTKTALEELYTLAKDYDADVVYTAARYIFNNGQALLQKSESFSNKPTLEVDAAESLLQRFFDRRSYIFWTPWLKFVRRNFLIENEIFFPKMYSHEDNSWTIELLCCAKRFVIVSNAVYYWRENTKSISRSQRPPAEQIRFWESITSKGIVALTNLWSKYDVLKKHPDWLYTMLNYFFYDCFFKYSFQVRAQISSNVVFESLCTEFKNDNRVPSSSYIPYLYACIDDLQKQLIMNQQRFNQFAAQAQKRIAELEAQLKTK